MTKRQDSSPRLAAYAVADGSSRGRAHAERETFAGSPFELDHYRIMNCMAFRRLRHKTQVFVADYGDHFRTRLTHTLEVAAQARRLARLLNLNDELASAVGLAHDLGHPPFGHAGEAVLTELMHDHGGFEHNLQSLRVVDYLEHPYPAFRGLNLTFELRESLIKHRTKYDRPNEAGIDPAAMELLETGPRLSLEGQVANLADGIAYTLHDIEDGLVENVLGESVLKENPLWSEAAALVRADYPSKPLHAIRRPILDLIARRMVQDAASESIRRIQEAGVSDVDEVRHAGQELIAFSESMEKAIEGLQSILYQAVYRNHLVIGMDSKARRLIREIFGAYVDEPGLLPGRYASRIPEQGIHRVACDYVAGMTDRFCQQEHQRLHAPFHFS